MSRTPLDIIIPAYSGSYDSARNYEILEIVSHRGDSYISKKPSKNIAPSNTEYWQRLTDVSYALGTGIITEELDPTVPAWAKTANKPTYTASEVNAVPTARTVNGKALSTNITLAATDVSAVPTARTVNGKALSADITLAAADVSAVPTTRTVNGKALSANVTLSASDMNAVTLTGDKADPSQISAPIVSATANKTLALTDAGCYIEMNATSALTVTIPADATVNFPVGTEIEIIQEGTGEVTIAAASGVTLQSPGGLKKISERYVVVSLKKRAANDWRLTGALA